MSKTKKIIRSTILALFCGLALSSSVRAETLKIGFVTDWEFGTKKEYDHKMPRQADNYLKKTVKYYNNVFKPDIVVGGGDYILSRSVSRSRAIKQIKSINKIFKKTSAPRLYCIGNHDLSDLSKGQVRQALGIDYDHLVTDLNGVRLITIDTNSLASGEGGYGVTGRLPDGELEWLEEQLDTDLPVIVFSHQSPISTPENGGWRTNIYNAVELRETLEKNGNVAAVFSGHAAVNYSTEVNGINYVIINNLVTKTALGSFANISVEKSGNNVSVFVSQLGKSPATYSFSMSLSN